MVHSVLEIPADIKDTVPSTVKLGAVERQILDEFIYMRPLKQATDIKQGDNYNTASTVVPTIFGLRYHLDHLSPMYNVSLGATPQCHKTSVELCGLRNILICLCP